uniref:anaphase-promoting complex subunit 1 n=1 Tax=Erigeron canadensis TaxID=72917 RepID=UPI001CB95956|nr:anaphase-promoting complex subunit 1 [Erigeron canadensis]
MSSIGVRHLTVLGEFKPFGLIAEALDGKPADEISDEYEYFLFDPEVTRQRDETDQDDNEAESSSSSDRSDHELFIRGNRIIWSIGARVYKRFSLPGPVIMACWCRMGNLSEAQLCVLQVDSLTIYNTSGDAVSIPLPCAVTSIWPLPSGLLLQQTNELNTSTYPPYLSSSPLLHDIPRSKQDLGYSPQLASNSRSSRDHSMKVDGASLSSHLVINDPLEEPHPIHIEERGRLTTMKEFDEKTIWTSDHIPLMASYHKGKKQHSLWTAEVISSNLEACDSVLPDVVLSKKFLFRRIWQGKGAQAAASEVFLATDNDANPIICFLLQEQKKLLSVRIQCVELNNEILYDIRPDMSWSIPAIVAAPVVVTRPRVKVGHLPYRDIIVLAPENTLVLYSGKQCLCRYVLPSFRGDGGASHNAKPLDASTAIQDVKIIGLAHAVEGRINVIVNNGQMLRCTFRRYPSSSLSDDCIAAMAEGLEVNLYNHFMGLLWGNGNSAYLSGVDSPVDSEWESFCAVILQIFGKHKKVSQTRSVSSWEFLVNSCYHEKYSKSHFMSGFSPKMSLQSDESCSASQQLDTPYTSESLIEILDLLHAVYESLKLNHLRKRDLGLLVVLLCEVSKLLGEAGYVDYYMRDFPAFSRKYRIQETPISQRTPLSLFRWLENCLRYGYASTSTADLPDLMRKDGSSVASWARKIVIFYSFLCGREFVGNKLSSDIYCKFATGSASNPEELTVLAMVGERFGLQQLDLLPAGVSLPLRHALDKCRECPPTDWPASAYVLLGREDLSLSCLTHSNKSTEVKSSNNMTSVSMSTPYMLHLHPVTIPPSITDSSGLDDFMLEDASMDGFTIDGMEHIFNASTQLRYGRDMRLNEVRRLLCSARPVAIRTPVNPTATDQDLQQAQLWQLALRTTALPVGRGAFTLSTTCTLLTEALPVPKLILAGRLPAQQNATVNLDPSIRNIQELISWPEFHNAVAAGLRMAPLQGKMSRTWIIYNKPEEPNVTHAGLLLALGLHGHLDVLIITDIYQYFSQENESTSVGLMLGLAASYRGTMQPDISKALYVHIPARHPSPFQDLELPTVMQSAALVSVGLLYEGSAHPQTMQVLLGEIGRRSGGDNVLEREGYAVSAGFSLGLVALGRGLDAIGYMDKLVDRLLQYAGSKDIHQERSLLSNKLTDDYNRGSGQMMDGTQINIDVTAPGAIIALGLIFLKTESLAILSRLCIPQTHSELQYVRPDFIMFNIISRNLIMWSRIHPSEDWIQSQIPKVVLDGIKGLKDEMDDSDDMDIEAVVKAYVYIVAGACISLGLRFAGTKDGSAQDLLYSYAVAFLNEIKPLSVKKMHGFPRLLSQYVDRSTLETCLHLIVLSLSVVMAGTGHLPTFRLLKFMRCRNSADGHINYGTQMAVSLSIGFLFLGGGTRTFSTCNSSIAALLITLYPRFPTGPNDNRCHLQAYRHLYVIATEARWVQTVDVDTGLPVYAPLEVTIKETEHYAETSFCEVTPCILPERAILKTVRVCGPRYWPQVIELNPEEKPWWKNGDKNDPFNSGILYIKLKVGACSYVDDPIGRQSLLSRAMHKVFGLASLRACTPGSNDDDVAVTVNQLVSTFSSDPSLIAFGDLCCDHSWNIKSDTDFQEFCLQVLFECVSKDRPALLQVYLSLYTTVSSMVEQVISGTPIVYDSQFLPSLKLALAYNDALLEGRLSSSRGSIVQLTFLGSLNQRVKELLEYSPLLRTKVHNYFRIGEWSGGGKSLQDDNLSTLLSWYLQWYSVPPPWVVKAGIEKLKSIKAPSLTPLLRLLFPGSHINAIKEIDFAFSSRKSYR